MSGEANTDRVSVVMPLYNAEPFVRRAVQSVLDQTHGELELIIVDDGSSDASLRIVTGLAAEDPRIRIFRNERNSGVARTRNHGLEVAAGRYIAFLDSDDWWHPGKLAMQIDAMRRSGASISYGTYLRVDEDGQPINLVVPPDRLRYADLLKSNHIAHSTGIYDRAVLGNGHRFQVIGHEDYVFWLGLLRQAGPAIGVAGPDPIACYLVRGGSVSSNKLRAARWQWRIYRDQQDLGLAASAWYMAHYAFNAVRKRRSRPHAATT